MRPMQSTRRRPRTPCSVVFARSSGFGVNKIADCILQDLLEPGSEFVALARELDLEFIKTRLFVQNAFRFVEDGMRFFGRIADGGET